MDFTKFFRLFHEQPTPLVKRKQQPTTLPWGELIRKFFVKIERMPLIADPTPGHSITDFNSHRHTILHISFDRPHTGCPGKVAQCMKLTPDTFAVMLVEKIVGVTMSLLCIFIRVRPESL